MKTTAIQQMTAEHRHIENVINFLHAAAADLENRRQPDVEKLRNAAEFLRVYADRRHHQREEALFFPLLVKRGVPAQGCPLGGLNRDHEKGRALVLGLDEQVVFYERRQPGTDQILRQTLLEIVKLYRHHLWMEDAMVFPMAEKLVTPADDRELAERFADVDRALGPALVARLEQFASGLSTPAGTLVPA